MLVLYQKQFTSVFSTVASYISIIAELRILNREFFLLVYTFSSNKMSNLRVETNLPRSCFDIDQLSAELAEAIASVSKHPTESFMVVIVPDAHIRIGPKANPNIPLANVSLTYIRTGITTPRVMDRCPKRVLHFSQSWGSTWVSRVITSTSGSLMGSVKISTLPQWATFWVTRFEQHFQQPSCIFECFPNSFV